MLKMKMTYGRFDIECECFLVELGAEAKIMWIFRHE